MSMLTRIPRTLCAALTLTTATFTLQADDTDPETYLKAYGWIVSQQSGLSRFGLSDAEFETVLEGMKLGMAGENPPANIQMIGGDMNKYLQERAEGFKETFDKRMEKVQAEMEKQAEEANAALESQNASFFAELDGKEGIAKTESGLYYEIIEPGSDVQPTAEDEVLVHYEGTLTNGEIFDSSYKRGQPIDFPLNGVIPGWTEGLQLIGEGGKAKLYIPPALGYGERGTGSIPPNSVLVFTVELIKVNPNKKVAVTPPLGIEDAIKAEEKKEETKSEE